MAEVHSAALLKTPCTAGNAWSCDPFGAAGPAATGTRRLAGPRREVQDELGCGEGSPGPQAHQRARYVLRCARPLKPATVLFEGDDPRFFATITVTIILGWIFLASGIMGLITTFRGKQAPGFWWSLVSALIAIGVGLILLAEPITGAVSLTLVLIVFFVVEGVATIMYALEHRRELSGRWEWMLVSGIIDLVLAGIILAGLPGTAAWALGLLVGINMVFGGVALVGIALHARSAVQAP
jgi:uncharacterized membrane protein HdeD (DUF308 family)